MRVVQLPKEFYLEEHKADKRGLAGVPKRLVHGRTVAHEREQSKLHEGHELHGSEVVHRVAQLPVAQLVRQHRHNLRVQGKHKYQDGAGAQRVETKQDSKLDVEIAAKDFRSNHPLEPTTMICTQDEDKPQFARRARVSSAKCRTRATPTFARSNTLFKQGLVPESMFYCVGGLMSQTVSSSTLHITEMIQQAKSPTAINRRALAAKWRSACVPTLRQKIEL